MCVDGLGYVVCECHVALDECEEPPPCMCVWCCSEVFLVFYFRFLCEICLLYYDVWLRVVYEVFSSSILFLIPFMFI